MNKWENVCVFFSAKEANYFYTAATKRIDDLLEERERDNTVIHDLGEILRLCSKARTLYGLAAKEVLTSHAARIKAAG